MSKAGSKGIPGANRIADFHAKAIMPHRLRLGNQNAAQSAGGDASQQEAILVEQSLGQCFFSPDSQVEQPGNLRQFLVIKFDNMRVPKRFPQDMQAVEGLPQIDVEYSQASRRRVLQERLDRNSGFRRTLRKGTK